MSVSLLALKRLIANTPGLGYAYGTISAGSSASEIIDTSGDSPFDPADSLKLYENAYAMIEDDSAGSTNEGEVRRVRAYHPGSGTLTLSRGYTSATTTNMRYGLYLGMPPVDFGTERGILSYVNDVLRLLRYRTRSLLTLATDGDMETTGTTNWTASSATLTKNTTAAYVFAGKQSLRVANTGANGYARSALVPVREGENIDLLADVRVVSGTAKLQLYDETNGAEIDSVTTNLLRPGYLYITNTVIPSGCLNVSARLAGVEASADVYWDNVSLRRRTATEMAAPSWLTDPDWFEELYATYGGYQEEDNDSYGADERGKRRIQEAEILADHGGATPYQVRFTSELRQGEHLWLEGIRPFAELSADADTTDADQDWVKAWVLALIFRGRQDKERAAHWLAEAQTLHRQASPRIRRRAYPPVRGL